MESKKLLRYLLIGAVVLILLAIIGKKAGWFGKSIMYEVVIEEVQKRDIVEVITANGKVQPETEVKLSPDVSGEIVELHVKDGDKVKKGELLLRIKPDNYISIRDRAEAAVNSAKANLANSQARQLQIEAQYDQSLLSYERNKKLWESGTISNADWESSEASYRMAKADLEAAKQSVLSARYSVKSAEAALKESEEDLRKTSVYAPMDGTVSVLHVELGERVAGTSLMSGTELLSIADLSRMEVLVEVNENDIVRVNNNDTALIEFDAYLERKFKGIVTEIANSANVSGTTTDQVTNFNVKILLLKDSYMDLITDINPYPFRPGMSATADIQTDTKLGILTIPIEAVTTRTDSISNNDTIPLEKRSGEIKEVVFTYQNGKVQQQEIKSGIQDNQYIEITDGLIEKQKIVVAPYNTISKKLEDGMEVNTITREELLSEKKK